jgi:catechol 2,3-dioxygenase-like lactoylglutathione lyase family enzyme
MSILINIDVPDVQQALAFYTAALDCQLLRILDEETAELAYGAARIYLLQKPGASAASPHMNETRHYSRHWTPVHMDFVVADLAQAVARAELAGARRESSGTTWRGSTHVTFSDPFGHGFCLIAFTGQTYE